MLYTKDYFEKILSDLEENLKKAKIEMESCPAGKLMQENRGGKLLLFHSVICEDGKRTRKLLNKKPEVLNSLLRKEYLSLEIAAIEKNIRYCQMMIDNFQSMMPDDIFKKIPTKFKHFQISSFLEPQKKDTWADQPYEKSTYKSEAKIHTTSRGLSVRSKSELLIAEMLYTYDIPFRYEEVMHLGKYPISTDFTLRNKRTRKLYYWEHCGMVQDEKYMAHHKWKLSLYESVGIVPWKNLIITYDGLDGTLNLASIESEIVNKLI